MRCPQCHQVMLSSGTAVYCPNDECKSIQMNKTPDNENEVKAVKAWAVVDKNHNEIDYVHLSQGKADSKAQFYGDKLIEVLITPITSSEARHSPQVEGEKSILSKAIEMARGGSCPPSKKITFCTNPEKALKEIFHPTPDQNELNYWHDKCDKLEAQLAQKEAEVDMLDVEISEARQESAKLYNENSDLESTIEQLAEKLERYEKALNKISGGYHMQNSTAYDMSETARKTLTTQPIEPTVADKYRMLNKGEIVLAGDEYLCDADKKWKPVIHTVGREVPDPAYTSHTLYRRQLHVVIEPTVAESARVQVSAEEALNWLHRKGFCIECLSDGYWTVWSNEEGEIDHGINALEAIRSAMASEAKEKK